MKRFTKRSLLKNKTKILTTKFKNTFTSKLPRIWPQTSPDFNYNSITIFKNCRPAWKTANPLDKILNLEIPFVPHPDYKYIPLCFLGLETGLDKVYTKLPAEEESLSKTVQDNTPTANISPSNSGDKFVSSNQTQIQDPQNATNSTTTPSQKNNISTPDVSSDKNAQTSKIDTNTENISKQAPQKDPNGKNTKKDSSTQQTPDQTAPLTNNSTSVQPNPNVISTDNGATPPSASNQTPQNNPKPTDPLGSPKSANPVNPPDPTSTPNAIDSTDSANITNPVNPPDLTNTPKSQNPMNPNSQQNNQADQNNLNNPSAKNQKLNTSPVGSQQNPPISPNQPNPMTDQKISPQQIPSTPPNSVPAPTPLPQVSDSTNQQNPPQPANIQQTIPNDTPNPANTIQGSIDQNAQNSSIASNPAASPSTSLAQKPDPAMTINLFNDDLDDPEIQYTEDYLQKLKNQQIEQARSKRVFQIKKQEEVHLPFFVLVPKSKYHKPFRLKKIFNPNTFRFLMILPKVQRMSK